MIDPSAPRPPQGGSAPRGATALKQRSATLLRQVITYAVAMPRLNKRVVLVLIDFFLLLLAVWLTISLRYGEWYVPPSTGYLALILACPLIGIATFMWFGMYRLITRFIGSRATTQIVLCVMLSVLLWALVVLMSGLPGIPRSAILMYGLLATASIVGVRQLAGASLRQAGVSFPGSETMPRDAVVIFGATQTGKQIVEALQNSGEARVAGFIDETASLWGQYINGVKVYRPEKLSTLIAREGVREVIVAIPAATRRERQLVLAKLSNFPVRVKTLPALSDLATGRVTVSDLRPVDVEDLLGRDPVPPDPDLLARTIKARSVMVTGAGGSIGSELVRQILAQRPSVLVLFEQSETALYEIALWVEEALAKLKPDERPVVASVLGSILDETHVRKTIEQYTVQTIFHAAAYKHVPIVELNWAAGLTNNTFGTLALAKVARDAHVERLVLISTDKAVRPTNVMGASKRLSELILQAFAQEPHTETVFTMVRFGNVLDSSGSVVRRFRRQIELGGPVTVTHKDVIRYFMSIPEAAELVIQAGAMGEGGDVFVLEMGEPVKIDALARSMIRLMGREVRDEANPEGDIAIAYVGLRPGEKLFEELLLGETTTRTEHPRINRNHEPLLALDDLERELEALKAAMQLGDRTAIDAVLLRTVEGYQPGSSTGSQASSPGASVHVAPSRTLH